ncbi:hypothetical protein HPMBJEAJ_00309 [Aeromonas phage avDM6]|nr:hypothetical protein HPMBJEAJ_00309 [Aeromonas phage avDM6]
MEMTEYYDSLGWKPFSEHMCDKIYEEMFAKLVIRTKEPASPPYYNDVFVVNIQWKQGHGDNWYFETEEGEIFKPYEVKEYLFDFS